MGQTLGTISDPPVAGECRPGGAENLLSTQSLLDRSAIRSNGAVTFLPDIRTKRLPFKIGLDEARGLRGCDGLVESFQRRFTLKDEQVTELLYQALETEMGGVKIYETALKCAVNPDLKEEWEGYFEQTQNHVQIVLGVMERLGIDPEKETPGRQVVRLIGESLVEAMELALEDAPQREAAELVACECVVLAETKDHLNWELIHEVAEKAKGPSREALRAAYEEVEEQEDEHLYHTTGWGRELWIHALGMPAVLPPPEEQKEVKTAIGAARAKMARKEQI